MAVGDYLSGVAVVLSWRKCMIRLSGVSGERPREVVTRSRRSGHTEFLTSPQVSRMGDHLEMTSAPRGVIQFWLPVFDVIIY
jgi:hypothetical protein